MVFSQLVQLSILWKRWRDRKHQWEENSIFGISPFNGNIWWFFRALNYWFLGHQSVTRYQYTQIVMTFVIRQLNTTVKLSAGIQESFITRYKPRWMLCSHKWHVVQTFWSVKCDTNNLPVWPQPLRVSYCHSQMSGVWSRWQWPGIMPHGAPSGPRPGNTQTTQPE